MIAWFARNHVAANLLMLTILFTGLLSLSTRISLEIFPLIEIERVTVNVALPGSTPVDIEQAVAVRIEEAVHDLEGIDQIVSRSVEGSTSVNIDIDRGYDPREMLDEIKARVDAINTFPSDAEKPVISIAQHKREVITVAIAGDYSETEIREFAETIRDDLLRIDGITQVELDGVRNYEVTIEVSRHKLRQFNLKLEDVATAVRESSLNLSAGNIKTSGGDVLIRSEGQSYRRHEFENIVVKTNVDGSILKVADLAKVTDGFEESSIRTRFNGKKAAMIEVYRIGKQSAIEVADDVKNYIEAKQPSLPSGMILTYWDDDSQIVRNRLNTLINNAIQGGILVFLLLTLFLRPAIAFWVFVGVPIAFMGAFLFMPLLGVTLNIFSLFAFILVLGIVVDDAIVTGENVYRHLRKSESGIDAAINGTKEVAIPVTFGVLTTVAAFLPMGFIEGHRGALFMQIPAVVIPVLLFSLIESKFVLPSHLKFVKLSKENKPESRLATWQKSFADGFENFILQYYHPFLKLCLRHRYTTLFVFIGILAVIIALVYTGWTRYNFMPRIQSETARSYLTMPSGTPFEVTDRYISEIADAARTLQDKYRDPDSGESVIMNILAMTGTGGHGARGTNIGRVHFEIMPPERRTIEISSSQLVREWRKMIGKIPGAETLTFRAEIGRGGDPIDVQLSGNSLQTLSKVAEKVKIRLATYPTVFDIADSLSDGKEELQIELTPQGHALGLTRSSVVRQVRNAFYGSEVQRVQRGRDDVRVFVRFPENERNSVSNLKEMMITAPGNRSIPLSHVAILKPGKSPSAIYRIDRYRTLNVTADVDKQNANMIVLQADLKSYLDDLVKQYPDVGYKLMGEAKEQRESFGSMKIGIVFILFIIYCLLAIPFKSYIQPFIVMSVIPFGAIGAILGHGLMGMDLSIMSLLGLMALIGVVVNDSLVLVDFINKQRLNSKISTMEAILNAGVVRFRPVMLTSLTTFIGLMPLLFEKSTQAKFLIPMAVSLGFGILFATVITLILVPANYLFIEDIRRLFGLQSPRPVDQPSH